MAALLKEKIHCRYDGSGRGKSLMRYLQNKSESTRENALSVVRADTNTAFFMQNLALHPQR
jgi:hypothetical protein